MNKDRKDGKYVTPTDALHTIVPYIMNNRTDAEVYIREELDITELKKWIDKKNEKGDVKITYFHTISAAFIKTIYNRPLLNRFVQGRRTYQRNKVSLSFVAKDKLSDKAEEKLIVMDVPKTYTTVDLSQKIAKDVCTTRKSGTNDMDKILKVVNKMPRWLLRMFIGLMKWFDYHGWVPKAFTEGDSNFSTILVSNLGSIKSKSCYHHLNNYGTNSIMITIGLAEKRGNKYVLDIGCTIDERIADGFYFAKSLKIIKHIVENPELLDETMDTKIEIDE